MPGIAFHLSPLHFKLPLSTGGKAGAEPVPMEKWRKEGKTEMGSGEKTSRPPVGSLCPFGSCSQQRFFDQKTESDFGIWNTASSALESP